jgi:hypothetical protein
MPIVAGEGAITINNVQEEKVWETMLSMIGGTQVEENVSMCGEQDMVTEFQHQETIVPRRRLEVEILRAGRILSVWTDSNSDLFLKQTVILLRLKATCML